MTAFRFSEFWRRLGATTDPIPVFEEIFRAYINRNRHYHNFNHINQCLTTLESTSHFCHKPNEVGMALFLHDFVYNPGSPTNEEESADFAERALAPAGVSPDKIKNIVRLILATKHKEAVDSMDLDASVMTDIDLSILGASRDDYRRYADNVRKEYVLPPVSMSPRKFDEGRLQFLLSFLARDNIFSGSYFQIRYGDAAIRNLGDEVREIEARLRS